MDSTLHLSFDLPSLAPLWVRAAAWFVVVVACVVARRRPWAWPGLAGGVLGLGVSIVCLADGLQARSDASRPSAHVVGADYDYPGFLADLDLYPELEWVQTVGLVLIASALVTGAVLSRRRARLAG